MQVRLTYSKVALLEEHVHLVEDPVVIRAGGGPTDTLPAPDDGVSMLVPHQTLINPPIVRSHVLHWPWGVKAHVDGVESLASGYAGRRLDLVYNPMTGRAGRMLPSFFATVSMRPPGVVDRPHHHRPAAITYCFRARGWSTAGGRRYDWAAGDLVFTPPGWRTQSHASHDDVVYELTIHAQRPDPLRLVATMTPELRSTWVHGVLDRWPDLGP